MVNVIDCIVIIDNFSINLDILVLFLIINFGVVGLIIIVVNVVYFVELIYNLVIEV